MGYGLVQEITASRPRDSGPEWWLLIALALDASDTTRRTAPGLEYMLTQTGAPRSTVMRWLKKLRAAGLIRTVQHSISGGVAGGNGKRAVYEIVMPGDWQAKYAADTLARQGRMILADTTTGYMTGFPVVTPERGDELAEMRYADYLLTPEWKARRLAVLEWAAHSCQVCSRTDSLHVHHRTYVRRGHERPSDLIVLCADCHALFHGKLPAPDIAAALQDPLTDCTRGRCMATARSRSHRRQEERRSKSAPGARSAQGAGCVSRTSTRKDGTKEEGRHEHRDSLSRRRQLQQPQTKGKR